MTSVPSDPQHTGNTDSNNHLAGSSTGEGIDKDSGANSGNNHTPMHHPRPSLRWLGRFPSNSAPNTPISSHPPSPALRSLNEALHEPCITPGTVPRPAIPVPAPVHLPPTFAPGRILSRPPPLLQHLTRTSLPIASLSKPPSTTAEYHPIIPVSSSPTSPLSSPTLSSSPTQRRASAEVPSSSMQALRRYSTISAGHPGHQRKYSSSVPTTPVPQEDSVTNNWGSGWWWFSNNRDQVDPLLSQEDRADDFKDEQDKIRKRYKSPKNPVVFCHGLLGFDSVTIGPAIAPLQVAHWRGIKSVLEANGTEVLVTRVPATSSPVDRAKVLEKTISEAYPGRSVHLIGHSMGGLDCRYLTTHLTQRTFEVLSITTIATPHRGSTFADHFLSLTRTRLPQVLSLIDMLPNGGGDGKAFESLTVEAMKKFNEETKDVEGVKYFSWGASYEPGFVDTWKYPHGVILEKEGENDGLVSVESAKWGKYMGTLTHVNHLDLVGWINAARYKWAELTGKEIKFRPGTFYLGVADILAREVEGQIDHPEEDSGRVRKQTSDSAANGVPGEGTHGVPDNGASPAPEVPPKDGDVESVQRHAAPVTNASAGEEQRGPDSSSVASAGPEVPPKGGERRPLGSRLESAVGSSMGNSSKESAGAASGTGHGTSPVPEVPPKGGKQRAALGPETGANSTS